MSSYTMSMGIIWTAGMLVLAVAGMFLWHRRENVRAKAVFSGEHKQLAAVSAQLADLQARVAKIEKVLASVD
ncbi:hypothetical protein [Catellatospora sp. NPDC049609]|uniref:hypothetical protein n=1 Tax=Catellatospora sp. NPDC049609 TaxID=3155505 RepID=UPI00343A00D1